MVIAEPGTSNLFRQHILPIAYRHTGLLHALLGLVLCHMQASDPHIQQTDQAEALEHRVSAIRSLSSLLARGTDTSLDGMAEDVQLATILILVLHDVSLDFLADLVHSPNIIPQAIDKCL